MKSLSRRYVNWVFAPEGEILSFAQPLENIQRKGGSIAVSSCAPRFCRGAQEIVTPAQRHDNLEEMLINNRKAVYETAYAKNPQRWSGNTRNWQRVEAVHLNPDKATEGDANNIDIQTRKVA